MNTNELAKLLEPFIADYKRFISNADEQAATDELFKWRVVQHFQANWPAVLTSDNVGQALEQAFGQDGAALWVGPNYYPLLVLQGLARDFPVEVARAMNELFDERVPVAERLYAFEKWAGELMEQSGKEDKQHYQFDRAMLVYLTLRHPDRYYFYKNGMFNDFCSLTGARKPFGRGKRLSYEAVLAYLELADSVKAVLLGDEELWRVHRARLPEGLDLAYDANLLTQDFIYAVTLYLQNQDAELPRHVPDAPLNQILFGPPGTGKTYATIELAVKLIRGEVPETRKQAKAEFDRLHAAGQIEFITFHQSYAYEDFVIGIRPDIAQTSLMFSREKGVFYELCERASAQPNQAFVLIIDEINRGNISKIFGELITLLEPDKRIGGENELRLKLPGGERNFGVPSNVYLIGTMNTADKSIAMLDIALRRRFAFVGMFPDPSKLPEAVGERLQRMNDQLVELKGSSDWLVGHAYFMNADELSVMNQQIVPLLYEYFNGRGDFVHEVLEAAGYSTELDHFSRTWRVLSV